MKDGKDAGTRRSVLSKSGKRITNTFKARQYFTSPFSSNSRSSMFKSTSLRITTGVSQTKDFATLAAEVRVEQILVILLAVFLFGIAFRSLHAGTPGVVKGVIEFVLGIVCLFTLRKTPSK
jgi:hypothetical protein